MTECTHESEATGEYTEAHVDEWGDEVPSNWSPFGGGKSYCVDLDLHRWKCTNCGHIGFYSERARKEAQG